MPALSSNFCCVHVYIAFRNLAALCTAQTMWNSHELSANILQAPAKLMPISLKLWSITRTSLQSKYPGLHSMMSFNDVRLGGRLQINNVGKAKGQKRNWTRQTKCNNSSHCKGKNQWRNRLRASKQANEHRQTNAFHVDSFSACSLPMICTYPSASSWVRISTSPKK